MLANHVRQYNRREQNACMSTSGCSPRQQKNLDGKLFSSCRERVREIFICLLFFKNPCHHREFSVITAASTCAGKLPRICASILLPRRSHSSQSQGLHTSGSDESNWKHVLRASSPDRWDNIILLMTERERRSEAGRDVGRKVLLPQRGSLVLSSSTLSCRRC